MGDLPLSEDKQRLFQQLYGNLMRQLMSDLQREASEAARRLMETGALNSSSTSDRLALGLLLRRVKEGQRLKIDAMDGVLMRAGKSWDTGLADALYKDISDSLDEQAQSLPGRLTVGAGFYPLRISQEVIDSVSERSLRDNFDGFKLSVRPALDLLVSQAIVAGKAGGVPCPAVVRESLERFREDHPDPSRVAFIMMQFGKSSVHKKISEAIKSALKERGLVGLRADDKLYNDDLWSNVLTYVHGCGFGVAVFDGIEDDTLNPNVSLEVGYVLALGKPVCLLKDRTLERLPTDLGGKLHEEFDPHAPDGTIPPALGRWLADKGLG